MITSFRQGVRRIVEDIYGPEPVGQAGAGQLYNYERMQLSGAPGGGIPHYGAAGDQGMSYTGLVASPQRFQGGVQMGANAQYSVQAYPALPSGTAPPSLPGAASANASAMDLLGGL